MSSLRKNIFKIIMMAFGNSCMNTSRSMQLARRVTADQDIKPDIDFTLMIARKKIRNK